MSRNRWWLALSYVLATVTVQGWHDHGEGTADAVSQHEAGCADSRTHISGHPSSDLGHSNHDCVACHFRAEHHSCSLAPQTIHRPSTTASVVGTSPLAFSRSLRLLSCRAPPRV